MLPQFNSTPHLALLAIPLLFLIALSHRTLLFKIMPGSDTSLFKNARAAVRATSTVRVDQVSRGGLSSSSSKQGDAMIAKLSYRDRRSGNSGPF